MGMLMRPMLAVILLVATAVAAQWTIGVYMCNMRSFKLEAAGMKVVAVQPADSDRAKGQTVAENILTANPNIKAIYATNDEMALGALNAAKAAGKQLIIVGFDASPDALKSIDAGELSGSIAQFPGKIGELGTLTAAAVARGEKVDAFVNTGVAVVTKENVKDFLK